MAAINIKQLANQEDRFASGHRLCAGCGEGIAVRQVLQAIKYPVVVANATGCLEVATSIYPFTAWRVPWIHNAFENASSTISGVEAMYRSLVRQGKIEDRNTKFVAFGGDGATYDIGLQFISGAMERGHRFLYVCLNNEAYMNTGIQRSSATPKGTWTTTSPVGSAVVGKQQRRKDMMAIVAAHNIPYAAQAALYQWRDLMTKVEKAVEADGPAFINILAPCPRGWRFDGAETVELTKLAVEACLWPLYEVVDGQYRITVKPKQKRPMMDWFKSQARFAHLLKPQNAALVEEIQSDVDKEWEKILRLAGEA
ncbi:MAG: pyruvate ferredoxin oxidoreductase [Chloroflexota bacterium]|nr:MAG: pyruvate ferredoxin oxidoreductase [Chloroflexota bacterium]